MSVPKLRFPGFAGEWEKTQLRQVLKSVDAGWSPSCEERKAQPHEWGILKTTAVVWGGYDHTQSKALPSKLSPRAQLEVRADDILVTRAGPIERVAVVAHVEATRPKLMISDKLMRARVNEAVSPAFIARTLGTRRAQAFFAARKSGLAEAQANISQAILNATPIYIPSLPEQQKIAAFLGAVDAKLAALAVKQAALARFKAGLMQKLFSQQLRFTRGDEKAFPDWEEKQLEEVAAINKGKQLNRDTLESSGQYPVINGGITPSGYHDGYNTEAGTITISEGGNSCGYVGFQNVPFWSGGHCYALSPYPRSVLTYFLYQALKFSELSIMRLRVGSGLPNIQKGDLSKFLLPLPHPDEQQKIANALSALDTKIQAVADQVTKLKTFKKGLLQQMFV